MKTRCQTIVAIIGVLLLTTGGSASFEISGEYTEEGMKWLNENWGENITLGDVARIAYTKENYETILANVDPIRLEKVWRQSYNWGSRYPGEDSEFPYGASVWDDKGPVNIRNLSQLEKQEMGLEHVVTDRSGYVIIGRMRQSVSMGEKKYFQREIPDNIDTFTIDLFWGDTLDSLKLTFFSPDGVVMGPYYDDSDGIVNGRIFLQVSRPEGIEPGDWYAIVEGEDVQGTRQFMLLVL